MNLKADTNFNMLKNDLALLCILNLLICFTLKRVYYFYIFKPKKWPKSNP